MAEEASFPAGHRLSDDLRRIREARELSIDDVHNETRIARTLIESFEEGQLYDHPTYNRVYLRSFIKAYADALQIPREQALSALDAALEGTYQHALAQEYLTGKPSESDSTVEESAETDSSSSDSRRSPPEGPTAGGPEGRGGIVGPPRAVGEKPEEAQIPMDAPPDDAATESSSSSTGEESDESPEETPPDEQSDDTAARADEEGSDASPTDDEESAAQEALDETEEEESPTDDASIGENSSDPDSGGSDESNAPDMTGPEALRSSPDEDENEDAESDDQGEPSWMAEDPSDQPAADASEPESPDTPEPASMEEGVETGVVGEPTEMGSGGTTPSSQPTSPPGRTDASRSSGSGLTAFLQDANRRIIVTGVGIGVVLLVLAGLGIAYFSSGNGDPSTPTTETPAPTDTATAKRTSPASPDTSTTTAADTTSAVASPDPPPSANVTLGDRIHLLVLAVDNVSGLRLQRDDDLRRPYWIEEGDASVFPFERRAIIGSELQDVRLYVEGYRYPFSPADTVGGLELTRESLQAFVDTLRGSPDSLAVTPDTIPVGPLEGVPPAPEDTTLQESPSE